MRRRSIRRMAPLALLLASSLVVAGCNDDSDSDEAEVKDVLTGFFTDVAEARGEEACDALTVATVRFLSAVAPVAGVPATCPDNVRAVNGQLSEEEKEALKTAEVGQVTVSGDTATINPEEVKFEHEGESALLSSVRAGPTVLKRVGDEWKLESLG
jgi:hypothetical protein